MKINNNKLSLDLFNNRGREKSFIEKETEIAERLGVKAHYSDAAVPESTAITTALIHQALTGAPLPTSVVTDPEIIPEELKNDLTPALTRYNEYGFHVVMPPGAEGKLNRINEITEAQGEKFSTSNNLQDIADHELVHIVQMAQGITNFQVPEEISPKVGQELGSNATGSSRELLAHYEIARKNNVELSPEITDIATELKDYSFSLPKPVYSR